jgi:hypothetical protein
MAGAIYNLNALNPVSDINSIVELIRKSPDQSISPDLFYNKQLLDTIRLDANEYQFYRLADSQPISGIANANQLRRWAPLQAHTVPLAEGVPPASDKGSVETYSITAGQYGRYMEFTDKVDFAMVDPIIAHYTKEYSIVAIETLDLLAKEALEEIANPYYAGMAADFEALTFASKPKMVDLRKIVLSFDKQLVKPRSGNRFHVIASPEFYFDMIDDETVVKYMTYNNTTKTMYEDSMLVPMFRLEFYQTLTAPASGEFFKKGTDGAIKKHLRLYTGSGETASFISVAEDATYTDGTGTHNFLNIVSGYVKDSRTGQDASYIPMQEVWDIDGFSAAAMAGTLNAVTGVTTKGTTAATVANLKTKTWAEFKVASVYVIGKDALTKTGLSGQDSAKMFVKPLGSAGVLDPIDQRQSIGFKINSVGFGSTRLEAVVRYLCVPSTLNI